jgi:hypothetical protein
MTAEVLGCPHVSSEHVGRVTAVGLWRAACTCGQISGKIRDRPSILDEKARGEDIDRRDA